MPARFYLDFVTTPMPRTAGNCATGAVLHHSLTARFGMSEFRRDLSTTAGSDSWNRFRLFSLEDGLGNGHDGVVLILHGLFQYRVGDRGAEGDHGGACLMADLCLRHAI